ncbi:MAG: tRNA pseudouridine(55) synthase TruB [Bifidobacteriaceae bacterium]|nr:tRNA pseudouridine(55) synthase TruB [Bifidobacteriaceae bacterium]
MSDGIVLVDKPAGWTSHDVVARTRRLAGTRRVGHAGTRDPMATGLLVLGVGRGTRLRTDRVGCDKDYAATLRLGAATLTDDSEGEVVARAAPGAVAALEPERIAAAVAALTGEIDQVPSAVSAIKVDGRRAYARVRAGERVELAARRVVVSRFEVRGGRASDGGACLDLDAAVTCSSGTYIRALARDLGAALGVGGHLTALRRTRVGDFPVEAARTLEELGEEFAVTPLAEAARARFEARELSEAEADALWRGQPIPRTSAVAAGGPAPQDPVAAFAGDGRLVALLVERDGRAWPTAVFPPGV